MIFKLEDKIKVLLTESSEFEEEREKLNDELSKSKVKLYVAIFF